MTSPTAQRHRSFAGPLKPLDRDRQRVILIAALLTGIVEILGLMGILPTLHLGRIALPPSILTSAVVIGLLGQRIFGRVRNPGGLLPYWCAVGFGMLICGFLLARDGHRIDALPILLASTNEEVVYRFAVPTVIAGALITLGARVPLARVAGFAVAGLWFVLLPGHREQMNDAAQVLPFLAFAALAALIVYRSGSFGATAAAHTVMNMLTIVSFGGGISQVTRAGGIACILILLVAAYGQRVARPVGAPAPATALASDLTEPVDDGAVIDLRDGVLHTHTSSTGTVTPLVEDAPLESDRH